MFESILKRLTGTPTPAPLAEDDARLALAALLVRVARADYDYAAAEITVIDRLLGARYDLTAAEAGALRAQAEDLETRSPDTVRFTRLIKDAIPYENRIAVAQDLWSVVLADNRRDAEEDSLLRLVVKLIGVSDRDSGVARQQAARKMP